MDGKSVGVSRGLETVSAASPTAEARDLVQGPWGAAQAREDEIGWGLAPGSPSLQVSRLLFKGACSRFLQRGEFGSGRLSRPLHCLDSVNSHYQSDLSEDVTEAGSGARRRTPALTYQHLKIKRRQPFSA